MTAIVGLWFWMKHTSHGSLEILQRCYGMEWQDTKEETSTPIVLGGTHTSNSGVLVARCNGGVQFRSPFGPRFLWLSVHKWWRGDLEPKPSQATNSPPFIPSPILAIRLWVADANVLRLLRSVYSDSLASTAKDRNYIALITLYF